MHTQNNGLVPVIVPSIESLGQFASTTDDRISGIESNEQLLQAKRGANPIIRKAYFDGSGRAELLDLAISLASSENPKTLVFYGPAGIGKSSLLHELCVEMDERSLVLTLRGHFRTYRQILELIAIQLVGSARLDLDRSQVIDSQLEALVKICLEERMCQNKALILLDDAHELPPQQLLTLLEFAQRLSRVAKFILFIDTHGGQRLRNRILQTFTHTVAIRPLSDEHLEDFLSTQSDIYAISDEKRSKVAELCEGVPGRVKPVAIHFDNIDTKISVSPSLFSTSRAAALVMLVGLFSLAFEYHAQYSSTFHYADRGGIESLYEEEQVSFALEQETLELTSIPAEHHTNSLTEKQSLIAGASELEPEVVQIPTEGLAASQEIVAEIVPAQTESFLDAGVSAADEGAISTYEDRLSKRDENTEAHAVLSEDEEVLLNNENAGGYVLQLLAGSSERAMRSFSSVYATPGREIRIYRTVLRGTVFYKATSGIMRDRAAALDAISVLPIELQRNHPWPKKITDVRSEIQRFLELREADAKRNYLASADVIVDFD